MIIEKVLMFVARQELLTLAVLTLLVLTVYKLWNYLKSVHLSLKLKGPVALPLIGNCLMIKEKNLLSEHVGTAFDVYGSLIRVWVLLFPFIMVIQPEDLQQILSSKKHANKSFFYTLLHNFLGNGLITSNGERWYTHRRLIQPTFHLSILERYIATFAKASQKLFESLDQVSLKEINITNYVNECILNILNEAIMGIPIPKGTTQNLQKSPFRQGKVVVPQRFLKPWLLLNGIYRFTKLSSEEIQQTRRLNEYARKMLSERRQRKAEISNTENTCLLDYLIEISDNNPEFNDDDIISEVCTFMLAGQESVGAAVALTIFLLAQNADCQQKCCEELERIFGRDERAPTMRDLNEMIYLEMCIKETLRLYPSVPLMARKLGEDVHLSNYTLPSGTNVFICPYSTHRIPQIYPEPEKYDPERFSTENTAKRHQYAYLPFSAGPRYCIGNRFAIMEMKMAISRLLRSFHIEPVAGKTTITTRFRITLRASGGLWVFLKPKEEKLMKLIT